MQRYGRILMNIVSCYGIQSTVNLTEAVNQPTNHGVGPGHSKLGGQNLSNTSLSVVVSMGTTLWIYCNDLCKCFKNL